MMFVVDTLRVPGRALGLLGIGFHIWLTTGALRLGTTQAVTQLHGENYWQPAHSSREVQDEPWAMNATDVPGIRD